MREIDSAELGLLWYGLVLEVWQAVVADAVTAYAPQLGAKLGITHTQLNVVGLAANGEHGPSSRVAGAQGPQSACIPRVRYGAASSMPGDRVFCSVARLSSC